MTIEDVTIDYGVFGVDVSAFVTDQWGNPPWRENLHLIDYPECESDWHEEGECDCIPEQEFVDRFKDHLEKNNYVLADMD